MIKEDMFSKVQEIFRDVFDDSSLAITDSSSSGDIEDWDSLNHVILLSIIQEEFGVKFRLEEMLLLNNVGDLINTIQNKLTE